jgi:hypothetical protein
MKSFGRKYGYKIRDTAPVHMNVVKGEGNQQEAIARCNIHFACFYFMNLISLAFRARHTISN